MGLCTSKSTVTLDPSTHTRSDNRDSMAAGKGGSPERSPLFDDGILMVQPLKSKAEGGGGGRTNSGGEVIHTAKGYLELGGGRETQISQEAGEEDLDEDGDEVEELINFTCTEGSLKSELLE